MLDLEIDKMLHLSTAHIQRSTSEALDYYLNTPVLEQDKLEVNFEGLSIYPKAEWGWFFYIDSADDMSKLPPDLREVVTFARDKGCSWLALDADADGTDALPIYEW